MSERSSVRLEQLLGDNYYIDKWSVDDPSPAVGDTVHVTLVVYDVFGDPVGGQTRTVTCTGGSFVGVNGQSITATDSVDVITEYGTGDVELELSVDVADVITVSSGRAECVVCSLSTSITNITGFSLVYDGYDHRIRVYTNGIFAYFIMQGTFVVNSSGTTGTGSIPSQYAPLEQTTIRTHPSGTDSILLGSDGNITYYATSGTATSRIVRIAYCYPVKASLP